MSSFPALLDTNVLFGSYLNDFVLALAERGLFRPLWSDDILFELEMNLVEHGIDAARAARRIDTMRTHFRDATVTGYASLIPKLRCDQKDRQVLVTFNLGDFPPDSVTAFDVEVVHPDQFLLDQLDLYPGPTMAVLRQLVADYSRPEMTIDDLLVALARAGVPEFARTAREHL